MTYRTHPHAFDTELTHDAGRWHWTIYLAGTGIVIDEKRTRTKAGAWISLWRSRHRLLRTIGADMAFLPIQRGMS